MSAYGMVRLAGGGGVSWSGGLKLQSSPVRYNGFGSHSPVVVRAKSLCP